MTPTQMYVDVTKVRTRDDARLTMRAVIYYELVDIEKMLDNTNDFTGNLISALSSDLAHFVAHRDFEKFKEEIHLLQEMENYPILLELAEKIGYRINNIVFRGYEAPENIQRMHEHSIATRTELLLKKEEEEQKQELDDYRLEKDRARAEASMELETQKKTHELQLQEMAHQTALKKEREYNEEELRKTKLENETQTQRLREEMEIKNQSYQQLAQLGADLTPVLVARETPAPHKRIEMIGTGREVVENRLLLEE